MNQYDYDDDEKGEKAEANKVHTEFTCTNCEAHNPYDQGFRVGDEIQCHYCGTSFEVRESGGKLKFREV